MSQFARIIRVQRLLEEAGFPGNTVAALEALVAARALLREALDQCTPYTSTAEQICAHLGIDHDEWVTHWRGVHGADRWDSAHSEDTA